MYHLYIITVSRIGEVRGSTPVKLRNVSALVERIYHSPDIFAYGLGRLLHYLWSHKPCLFFFKVSHDSRYQAFFFLQIYENNHIIKATIHVRPYHSFVQSITKPSETVLGISHDIFSV